MTVPLFLSVGKVTLTITRKTADSYLHGRRVEGTSSTFTITANVQPTISSTMTKLLPEGDRSKKALVVLNATIANSLRTAKEGTLLPADSFTWTDGDVYEIREVLPYRMGVLDHDMALAVRIEVA